MTQGTFTLLLGTIVVVLATLTDLRSRLIPNRLTLSALAVGLVASAAFGWMEGGARGALAGLGGTLAGVAFCSVLPLLSFARGELGGGDVKLLAALAALCGPTIGFNTQAFAYGVALFVVLPVRLWRSRQLGAALRNVRRAVRNLGTPRDRRAPVVPLALPPIAFAPVILAGFVLAAALDRGAH